MNLDKYYIDNSINLYYKFSSLQYFHINLTLKNEIIFNKYESICNNFGIDPLFLLIRILNGTPDSRYFLPAVVYTNLIVTAYHL